MIPNCGCWSCEAERGYVPVSDERLAEMIRGHEMALPSADSKMELIWPDGSRRSLIDVMRDCISSWKELRYRRQQERAVDDLRTPSSALLALEARVAAAKSTAPGSMTVEYNSDPVRSPISADVNPFDRASKKTARDDLP